MRQLRRLLAFLRPYAPHFTGSILLMAVVGLMDAFRILLMGPIIDRVLNPKTPGRSLVLFNLPGSQHVVYVQDFVPQHFSNPLTVVDESWNSPGGWKPLSGSTSHSKPRTPVPGDRVTLCPALSLATAVFRQIRSAWY